ncbi:DUF4334 domain-containing protein [Synechococcus sp. CCAP 1479/9]|uniref:DUF4334 domain-containing protein n=1 Tax=Synechococcus sp. CCAP 1479/9 TaxID=1221593 RepID=UPI001C24060B|nr:DUF4334 domain-containing protein [Synechococcus sp. CCAP 1479/9]
MGSPPATSSTSTTSTTEAAFARFDALPPVEVAFMLGAWTGESVPTGHPLDGALEAFHWHGKRFDSAEEVHPLVFHTLGGGLTCLEPRAMGPGLRLSGRVPIPTAPLAGRLFQLLLPLFSTRRSGARLRMTRYRGVESATMQYDHLPINDVFRKVDDDTVLGVMDLKGMETPFFFLLRREGPGPSHSVTISAVEDGSG